MHNYLGIDIGASSFKYGVGNMKTGLQTFGSIPVTHKNTESFREIFAEIISEVSDYGVSGIGIGCPGTFRAKDKVIVGKNPNIPFLKDISPAELLPKGMNLPVWVDNDANLMALAEAELAGVDSCVGITIGSGIGCGIVHESKIYHGASGFAGELGHIIMVEGGEPCSCGQHGCLEAYSSVDGIFRRLRSLDSEYADLSLPDLIFHRKDAAEIDRIISEAEDKLILALVNMAAILDPGLIVLGGGGMDLGLFNLDRINFQIQSKLPKAHAEQIQCVLADNGNRAGVLGGIILCERNLR